MSRLTASLRSTSSRTTLWLLVFTMAAFVLRLLVIEATEPVPPPLSDAEHYDAAARSLVRGDGYAVQLTDAAFLPGTNATAFFPPGYSFYLAGFYGLFGEGVAVARLANAVAGALLVPLTYVIGRRLFGPRAALIGAAAAALSPSLVFWTPVMLSETLFTTVFAAAVALSLYALRTDGPVSPRLAIATGVVVGLAVLVRGQALVLLPVAVVWWGLSGAGVRPALRGGVFALAGVLLVVLPWTARNYQVFDTPVLLSTNFGYNLRIGHAPYASGRFVDPADLYAPAPTYQQFELQLDRTGRRLAIEYARDHPGRELELAWLKLRWLWAPDTDVTLWLSSFGLTPLSAGREDLVHWLVLLGYWPVVFAAITGLSEWRRRREGISFVVLLCVGWTAVHLVFFGEPRYHLPLLPVIFPLAATGALLIFDRLRVALARPATPVSIR